MRNHQHSKYLIALGVAFPLVLTGCVASENAGSDKARESENTTPSGAAQAPNLSDATGSMDVRLNVELWDRSDFRQVSPGVCALKRDNGRREDISNNERVVLVGPDGSEIASSNFGRGQIRPPAVIDDGTFVNHPKRDICAFEAMFRDVPEVATYRVKWRGSGISDLSVDLGFVKDEGGFSIILGGRRAD